MGKREMRVDRLALYGTVAAIIILALVAILKPEWLLP